MPVPKVLAWDARKSNSAESEYILMEQAKGTQLAELWGGIDLKVKAKLVDEVVAVQKKLQSTTFSRFDRPGNVSEFPADGMIRYGRLYFKLDAFAGCSNFEVSGALPQSAKTYAEDNFVIGPIADKEASDPGEASMPALHGPCKFPHQLFLRTTANHVTRV
jgi:hypothetical protein